MIVLIATAIAMPIGVLIALFLTEYAGNRAAGPIRHDAGPDQRPSLDHHRPLHLRPARRPQQAVGFAASVALAIIELPLIARGSQEVLLLVPNSMREAADALGVSRWRSVLDVILPSALGGIVTSTVLAVARAAGETAPLIFATSVFDPSRFSLNPFEALPNVPVTIFQLSEEGNPEGFTQAWGAGPGPGFVHPLREPRSQGAARPQQEEDGLMSASIRPRGSIRPCRPPRVRIQSGPLPQAGVAATGVNGHPSVSRRRWSSTPRTFPSSTAANRR